MKIKIIKLSILFSILILFTSCPKDEELICGCTDDQACNYNPNADIDDGSCFLIYGCTDPLATNFDPVANCHDSNLCIYLKDNVMIEFYNHIDGTPLIFDSLTGYSDWYSTNSGQNFNILNLYYLITDIKLSDNNGNTLNTLSNFHFTSSDDKNSNYLFIPGILSAGEYENLEFIFGLKSENNISNSFIDEDFHTQMFWPDFMGGGYHYMKLEGKFDNETSFYATHTGGLEGIDYSISKSFPVNIISNEDGSTHNIRISMDINNWYSNPNNITINSDGIMGNAELQQKLKENGEYNVFNVQNMSD